MSCIAFAGLFYGVVVELSYCVVSALFQAGASGWQGMLS